MSPFEQPPKPSLHRSETVDAADFEHHNEHVESGEEEACSNIVEKVTAVGLMGAACAITALAVYNRLEGGGYIPETGYVPLLAFVSIQMSNLINKLESVYKRRHN